MIPKSTQTAVKNRENPFIPISNATSAWQGDNLTSGEYGFDDMESGIPFGEGEFGGIKHFEGS